jgi:hypothetical protein
MSADGDSNLLQWVITTFLALLGAGGGVAAYLRIFRPPRPKLVSRLWLLESPYYELSEDQAVRRIRRTAVPLPGPSQAGAQPLYPKLELDVTNPTDKRISVNAVRLRFSRLQALRQLAPAPVELVVQYRAGTPAARREALERKHGLALAESEDDLYTYRLGEGDSDAAAVLGHIQSEADIVEHAFTNEVGEPHKKFTVTETVDVKLSPGSYDYTYLIAHTVAPHDTVKIPVSVGASESLNGVASVEVVFESDKSHDAGALEVTVEVPDYAETLVGGTPRA